MAGVNFEQQTVEKTEKNIGKWSPAFNLGQKPWEAFGGSAVTTDTSENCVYKTREVKGVGAVAQNIREKPQCDHVHWKGNRT